MSLADLRRKSSDTLLKNIVSKAKNVGKAKTVVKKSNSILDKVKEVCDLVQQRLGKYKDDFECIQTTQRLNEYINTAITNGYISIDTETTGLDPITDEIVGLCIYTPNEKAAYVPINHISLVTQLRVQGQLTNQEVATELKRLIENNVKVIYFNAKFDIRVMRHQLGVDLPPAWDGFIAGKVLKEDEAEGNLKYLWKKYCSKNKEEDHFTFDKMFSGYKFNIIPINTAYLYAAKDAIMTWELYKFQEPYLTKTDQKCINCGFTRLADLYHNIELPIISFVADIEDNGIALDVEYCKELSEKYHKLLDEKIVNFNLALKNYENDLINYKNTHPNTKLEDPINISSPTQLAELFYDVLKLDPVSRKQPRGTGEEILQKLNHPLCKPILEYRGVNKLLTTYIDKMPEIVNKKTGRIHCSFMQMGTDCITGDTLIPNLEFPGSTIAEICENNIPDMDYGIYYPLQITIFNRYGNMESTSHCVKFKDEKIKKITFNDGSVICGTYNHPILMHDNIFKELQYINIGDMVKSNKEDKNLKVIDISFDVADVYDFKVPQTHSFLSNNIISHNTGRFSCIAAGSMISCPGGDKKIEEIQPGDFVYSYDSNGKLTINKVINNWFTGNKSCI
ncbi:MAG: DNA polymerase, partial [Intestinibacter sp.]